MHFYSAVFPLCVVSYCIMLFVEGTTCVFCRKVLCTHHSVSNLSDKSTRACEMGCLTGREWLRIWCYAPLQLLLWQVQTSTGPSQVGPSNPNLSCLPRHHLSDLAEFPKMTTEHTWSFLWHQIVRENWSIPAINQLHPGAVVCAGCDWHTSSVTMLPVIG